MAIVHLLPHKLLRKNKIGTTKMFENQNYRKKNIICLK